MKTSKNGPRKLLIIGPNLFFTVQPSPQPKIDFSYYKYVPRLICLLICVQNHFGPTDGPLWLELLIHNSCVLIAQTTMRWTRN